MALAMELDLDKHAIYEWFMKTSLNASVKNPRPVVTAPQIEELERLYVRCYYPNKHQFRDLSSLLDLENAVVTTWFRQRNAIERKLGNKLASDKYRPKVESNQCLGENDGNQQDLNKLDWEKIAKLKEFLEKRVYPNREEKRQLCADLGVDIYILNMWFATTRTTVKIRSLKPEHVEKLEEMYKVNKRPTYIQKQEMCNEIGLNLSTFESWYQIRRQNVEMHDDKIDVFLANIDEEQLGRLEQFYERNIYPSNNEIRKISIETGMVCSLVEKWFAIHRTNDMKAENRCATFSSLQLEKMNEFFAKYVYPSNEETYNFCGEQGLDIKLVKRWLRGERIVLRLNKKCSKLEKLIKESSVESSRKTALKRRKDSLEELYSACKFPTNEQKMELCKEYNASFKTIDIWFCNRRKADSSGCRRASSTAFIFNDDQLSKMEDLYGTCKHPSRQQIDELGTELGIDRNKIYTWMVRRRNKERKLAGVDHQRCVSSDISSMTCENQLLNDDDLETDTEESVDTSTCDDNDDDNDDASEH